MGKARVNAAIDLGNGPVGIILDERLEARIVQEEAWTQTVWPEGERSIAEVRRCFVAVRHVPHSPSSLMFFASQEEAEAFKDPDDGYFESVWGRDGIRRVVGTWLDCIPEGARFVEGTSRD